MKKLFAEQISKLSLANPAYRKFVAELFERTLAADVGNGDATTSLISNPRKKVTAVVIAKENGVLAGGNEFEFFWKKRGVKISRRKKDGVKISRGEKIFELVGSAEKILTGERTSLNFLQRMSGVATATHSLVEKFGKNKIAATRKTPFGLLDCRAVVLGGGLPHRLSLADQILVKENHLACDPNCWRKIRTKKPFEIEADSEKFAVEVAGFFAKKENLILMLDNFTPPRIRKIVPRLKKINSKITLEASGGITPKTVGNFLDAGVDFVSLGWLTHSAAALDFSLKIEN